MIILKTTKGNVFHTFSAKNIRRSTGWLVKGPKERLPVKKHAVAELHTYYDLPEWCGGYTHKGRRS